MIDSSAVVAIAFGEPERRAMLRALAADPVRLMSAVSVLEARLVIGGRRDLAAVESFKRLRARAGVQVILFSAGQAELAWAAWRRFGKGRHPAALNLGDCCAYALARATREPLLYNGDDFARTDVPSVLGRP